ncbi:DUF874 domain-containing protein [Rhodobacteraceae bacterium KMM 6894]|nr:DUF874 domain-containing protein [Rhodobacteraceae bacterium KMM 6894]
MGSIYSLADFFDMVRRRIVAIITVGLIGTVLATMFAASQQHLYRSYEVLQVQSARIADELVPTTIAGSSARRLQLIEQQVMAREALLGLIDQLGLFADQPEMPAAEKVAVMRKSVSIEGVAAAREGFSDDGTVSLLRISATWPTADGARQIANGLAQRTISLSVSTRLEKALETLEFFTFQEEGLQRDIAALEAQITQFRTENSSAMLTGQDGTRREIETLNEAITDIDRQMLSLQRLIDAPAKTRVERRDRESNQTALAGLIEERALLAGNIDRLSANLEGTPEVEVQLTQMGRQMENLREQLQAVTARRNEADVSYQLETQRQSERLTVLEPASLPDYPFTRSRKVLVVIGAFASLMAGLATAFVMDLRTPVIRSARQMERELGLMPVVSIPEARRRKPARPGLFARLMGGGKRRSN